MSVGRVCRSLAGFAIVAALLVLLHLVGAPNGDAMLDVRLFRNMRFTAASASVTIAFFSLFGFIFFMTQYFQFIQGYSPLFDRSASVARRVSVAVARWSVRNWQCELGTKPVVTVGLLPSSPSTYGWRARSQHRHQLRDDRRPNGAVRRGHGSHLGACDRVDHGSGADPQGWAWARP